MPNYGRVLIKISGEALMGNQGFGHDPEIMHRICQDIKAVHATGIEICAVVGGGNIFRGASPAAKHMERASADYVGMLATVMNAVALQNIFETMDVPTRVQSAIPMTTICETYIRRRAVRHMEKGRIVLFAGGTGNPFFTTDTASALRAVEMNCDLIVKATQVDGVYSDDPKKNSSATRYQNLTFKDVIMQDLQVMDMSAITLAKDNNIPIAVFSIQTPGSFLEVIQGKGLFTLIS